MIQVDLSKCTGCRRCETACAFFRTGRVNHHLACVKVVQLYEMGIDAPVLCGQCQERFCLKCPEGALTLGKNGEIIHSPTVCTLCGSCEKACPIGAIEIFHDFVFVCDQCGGRPRCVDVCTEGALVYDRKPKSHPSFADIKRESRKLDPNKKRVLYVRRKGSILRNKWGRHYA